MSDLTVDTPVQPRSNAGRQKPLNGVNLVRFKKITQVGIKSIFSHGLRSMLTVLGIVIGVAAVIAMLAVSEGASYEAQQQFRDLGASNILLKSVKPAEVEENSWNLGINTNTDVVGTTVDYPVSRNYNLRAGRFFSEAEVRDHANVVVLSDEVANALFPIDNPIGQSIKIDSDYYNVVGIMESEGFSNLGQSQAGSSNAAPSRIFIPFTASKSRFGETTMRQTAGGMESETVELHEAIIQIEGQESVIEVGEIIEQILQRRHKEVDYEIEVPLALLRQAEESALRDQIVAGAIAGISLLVGGIGIMNIMLASVTERTREIGIRRAMGAKKRDIITQFLVEAVILSGVGGVIGVVLGVVIPIIISIFWGMTTIVTPIAPILAFSISAMIGVIFGIYPSMRAADMDPVEALRHE